MFIPPSSFRPERRHGYTFCTTLEN
jgi:hypothetical protein